MAASALLTDIVYLKAGLGASITRSRGYRRDQRCGRRIGWFEDVGWSRAQFAAAYEMAMLERTFCHRRQPPPSISMLAVGSWWQRV